jgi:hypothetical protein
VTFYIVEADDDEQAIDAMIDGEGKEEDTTTMHIGATELEPHEFEEARALLDEVER